MEALSERMHVVTALLRGCSCRLCDMRAEESGRQGSSMVTTCQAETSAQ